MTRSFALAVAVVALGVCVVPVRAISRDDACARFASKLSDAVKAGDTAKAQQVYSVGSQRIASRFNGATCPNVQPPASGN
ncbi:hypothetical protein KBZ14_07245 [Synechococcus sp. HJ21-Hayes]|jgi:hypothetical protein|uniref:hypothetical protein n=1 Tax=unclassified Synechococcus TaxID=2626047 RepID=UPI0020CFC525|nr:MULTISPECIES: hypothetical protein [unclassified Synechococcus]MCP9831356.1 hypothetical protein [Synechococcus sp. JJ3a-Johnson]MCP9852663.1 hypothetical protein [Synechococcus sp. HJ21-Hayes]